MKKLFYRIGEACKQLDIQPYVLRYWETEFPVLSPKKSKAGQRVYSEEELRLIQRIKQLLYEEGYTIAGAKKKLEAELAADALPELGGAPVAEAPASARAPERPKAAVARAAAPEAAPAPTATVEPGPEAPEAVAEETAQLALPGAEGAPAAAPTPPVAEGARLDRAAAQQVETLRSGLQEALAQTRGILALLGD